MKRFLRIWLFGFMVVIASGLGGCSGGGAEVRTQSTTLGQELADLENSYKKGIITEKQYVELKQKLIEQRSK